MSTVDIDINKTGEMAGRSEWLKLIGAIQDGTYGINVKGITIGEDGITGGVRSLTKYIDVDVATYTLDETEEYDEIILRVNHTATAAVKITLSDAQLPKSSKLLIKDTGFNAATNNITITCETGTTKIENSINDYIINGDGDWLGLFNNKIDWYVRA